jgi:hypothetical protein
MLPPESRALFEQSASLPEDQQSALADAILRRLRHPSALSIDELRGARRDAQRVARTANDPGERELAARRLYDLDFEWRRREPWKWLGGEADPPRTYAAGHGPDETYPQWFLSAMRRAQ